MSTTSLWGVDLDATGDVLVTGAFSGSLTLDGMTISSLGSFADLFLTKLGGSTGTALWLRNIGQETLSESLPALRVDGTGNAWVMAWTPWGSVSPLPSSVSLTKRDARGELIWRSSFASPNTGSVPQYLSLSFDGTGNALISGSYFGLVNFGGGSRPQPDSMSTSAFLAWYGANGNYVTDRTYPIAGTNSFGSAGNDLPKTRAFDREDRGESVGSDPRPRIRKFARKEVQRLELWASIRPRAARNARNDSASLRREEGKRSRWPRSLRRAF
jgi:hypothetical protein